MVNPRNVARIMGMTLAISIVIDAATHFFLGFRFPWYAVTALLTLFMYACESDLSYQNRVFWDEWKKKVESKIDLSDGVE